MESTPENSILDILDDEESTNSKLEGSPNMSIVWSSEQPANSSGSFVYPT